jgi:hypothetical protein
MVTMHDIRVKGYTNGNKVAVGLNLSLWPEDPEGITLGKWEYKLDKYGGHFYDGAQVLDAFLQTAKYFYNLGFEHGRNRECG